MSSLRAGLLVALAAIVVILISAVFIVDQRQQALVLRFGAVRKEIKEPGPYLKLPLFESVVYFDRRVLDLDLPAQEVIASDQKRLVVDAYARYRIIDPLVFYQAVNTIAGANNRLGAIVSSTVRGVLGDATFTDVVRTEREALMKTIRERVNTAGRGLGVEVVDVRLRRVDLPDQNSQAVFDRMKTDRVREATDLRAQGTQQSLSIRARADRDVTVLIAEANRKAEELRGAGDAEKNRILAEAFGQDASFFQFYRWMQTYESTMKASDTRMVLSPSSDVLRYFNGPNGEVPKPAAPAPARP